MQPLTIIQILVLFFTCIMMSSMALSTATRAAAKSAGRQLVWQSSHRCASTFRAPRTSTLRLGRILALTGVVSTAAITSTSLYHSHTSECAAAGAAAGAGAAAVATSTAAGKGRVTFYPPIKPYETGMLAVSDLHSIAYSVYGNPKGKPVLVVHGGPGGGTTPGDRHTRHLFYPCCYSCNYISL